MRFKELCPSLRAVTPCVPGVQYVYLVGSLLTIPSSQRLVDTAVGIVLCLGAGQLRLHPLHPGAERLSTSRVFVVLGMRCGSFKVPSGGLVVASTALGV